MHLKSLTLIVTLLLSGTALAESGAELWSAKCKSCHGADGKANTKMGKKEDIDDLSNPGWQKRHSDEKIRNVITNGSKKNSKMKAYKDKLTAEQIDLLVQHIRTFNAEVQAK